MKNVSPPNDNEANQTQQKHRTKWLLCFLLTLSLLALWSCVREPAPQPGPQQSPQSQPQGEAGTLRLFEAVSDQGDQAGLRVNPGSEDSAKAYMAQLDQKLVNFPRKPLIGSAISDMLIYYGFPALKATDLEALAPAVIMNFEQLRNAVSNKDEFNSAYATRPLQAGEILVSRFFAPKIINVRDPQTDGVPKGGFGWRKVLRFKSRDGSTARSDGLDGFYLLFNFTSPTPKFPENTHAGQIQGILIPNYPTSSRHNDIYFLVYEGLGSTTNPGQVGLFLLATFDLAGIVKEDKYYVPVACGQCHGTERTAQVGGKVNYLDTDHWIDRTGDDFKRVQPADVLVDGEAPGYDTIRKLNTEIERQNAAVVGSGSPFALLAVRKWLDLHREGQPNRHVPPIQRGFVQTAGDANWTAGADPDDKLIPMLNQYCFRCHSSVRFHVFQKKAVVTRKSGILTRLGNGAMPQDRKLDDATKAALIELIQKLQ